MAGDRAFTSGSPPVHRPLVSCGRKPLDWRCQAIADPKRVADIYDFVVSEGREDLDSASLGLAVSGLAAGLNLSLSALAMFSVAAFTGGQVGLAAIAVYPLGFLIVVLGRFQLFTENTVTPVTAVLEDRISAPLRFVNLLRMWAVVLAANILGALIAAAAIAHSRVLDAEAFRLLIEEVEYKMQSGFVEMTLFAVYGGWIIALMAWLAASSQETIGRAFVVWITAMIIPAASLPHSVAGSSEVLVGVLTGVVSWGEYLGGFLLPAVIGNSIGGIVLVSLLNYGQVKGVYKKTRFAERFDPNHDKGL